MAPMATSMLQIIRDGGEPIFEVYSHKIDGMSADYREGSSFLSFYL